MAMHQSQVAAAQPKNKPNVILVIVDDMPFLSSFTESLPLGVDLAGETVIYPDYPTPNLDVFRSESVIFPQTFCAGPKCSPSRYSILTGRQPTRCQYAIDSTLSKDGEDGTNGPILNSQNIKLARRRLSVQHCECAAEPVVLHGHGMYIPGTVNHDTTAGSPRWESGIRWTIVGLTSPTRSGAMVDS